jgi:hypothetical protein
MEGLGYWIFVLSRDSSLSMLLLCVMNCAPIASPGWGACMASSPSDSNPSPVDPGLVQVCRDAAARCLSA